jgi:hypothetical protein
MALGVLEAVTHCADSEDAYTRMYGIPTGPNAVAARLALELSQFAMFNKDYKTMEKFRTIVAQHAKRMGFVINMYIFPQALLAYVSQAQVERTKYSYVGESGYRAFMDSPAGVGSLGRIPVYEAPTYLLEDDVDKVMTMSKDCTIGEVVWAVDRYASGSQAGRTTMDRCVREYDQDADSYVVKGMPEMLENCDRLDESGRLSREHFNVAHHGNAADMFFYAAGRDGSNKVCEVWGQMEEKSLKRITTDAVADSLRSKVSADDRVAIGKLLWLVKYLRDQNKGEVAQSVAETVASLQSLDLAQQYACDNFEKGGLGSWFGLESMRKHRTHGPVAVAGIDAVIRAYNVANAVAGCGNMVLDPERCPAHMYRFVEHRGPASWFEHVLSVQLSGSRLADVRPPLAVMMQVFAGSPVTQIDVNERVVYYRAINSGVLRDNVKDTSVRYGDIYDAVVELLMQRHRDVARDGEAPSLLRYAPAVFVHLFSTIRGENEIKSLLKGASETLFGVGNTETLTAGMRGSDWGRVSESGIFVLLAKTCYASGAMTAETNERVREAVEKYNAAAEAGDAAADAAAAAASPAAAAAAAAAAAVAAADASAAATNFCSFILMGTFEGADGDDGLTSSNIVSTPYVVHAGGKLRYTSMFFEDYYAGFLRPLVKRRPDGLAVVKYEEAMDPTPRDYVHLTRLAPVRLCSTEDEMDEVRRRMQLDVSYSPEAMSIDDALHFTDCPPFIANYRDVAETSDPVEKLMRSAFIHARLVKQVFEGFLRYNVTIPYGFALFRPFMEQTMSMVIAMRGGPDTGFTAFGHSNVMMSMNAMNKTMFMHLSYYSRSIVTQPNNVIKMQNVAYESYRGGAGTLFFPPDVKERLKAAEWVKSPEDFVEGFPSQFAIMIPAHDIPVSTQGVDIRGSYHGDNDKNPQYPSAAYYSHVLGFATIREGGRPGYMAYEQRAGNTLVFQGMQQDYIPSTGTFGNTITCKGHHGDNVQPGCKRVRAGEMFGEPDRATLCVK